MMYVRLYSDSSGETHFEDAEIDFSPTRLVGSAPAVDFSAFMAARRVAFLRAPVGWYATWHRVARRSVFLIIAGEWEIKASDGEIRRCLPGTVLLAEDTDGKGHLSRVVGSREALAAVVQLEGPNSEQND